MIGKDENIGEILNKKVKTLAIKDMLEQEYEPMIELNRQLEMIKEDGDWGEDVEKKINDRIDILWKSWCIIKIKESNINTETCDIAKFNLLLDIGIYHQQNENLTDPNIPIGIHPSEPDMKYIKEWAKEELSKY